LTKYANSVHYRDILKTFYSYTNQESTPKYFRPSARGIKNLLENVVECHFLSNNHFYTKSKRGGISEVQYALRVSITHSGNKTLRQGFPAKERLTTHNETFFYKMVKTKLAAAIIRHLQKSGNFLCKKVNLLVRSFQIFNVAFENLLFLGQWRNSANVADRFNSYFSWRSKWWKLLFERQKPQPSEHRHNRVKIEARKATAKFQINIEHLWWPGLGVFLSKSFTEHQDEKSFEFFDRTNEFSGTAGTYSIKPACYQNEGRSPTVNENLTIDIGENVLPLSSQHMTWFNGPINRSTVLTKAILGTQGLLHKIYSS